MKKVLKNTKGFTLVELLAVIVVLAVIILIAMPSVMSAMDKARKNSLYTEASEIIKIAQTAYADDMMNATVPANTEGYCYSLEYLIDAGYMDKNLGGTGESATEYGSVLLKVDSDGIATYTVWLTNKIYSISGVVSKSLGNSSPKKYTTADTTEIFNKCNSQGKLRAK